ncbi:MAG: acyl-CoA mutase large subunit family protein, partial [Ilumatobacteraceae bacterium]
RGTYVYPPRPSMRIITDIFAYCATNVPKWNTISISGYHIREAGSTAVQELAFTLANAIAYVQAAVDAGLDVDAFAPRLSFFWNGHNNFFEEVAKFRASRRMWYRIMTERFGAKNPASHLMRFHTQTGGATLTAQQPLNNVVRVAVQSMAAVMGGTQSLHTNGYDEALGLPTEEAARIALRTQQIIGYESGITDTPDPLAGSYYVESLTNEVERLAWEYIRRIDEMGGAVNAIESGFQMEEIDEAAYAYTKSIDDASRVIVGVNKFTSDEATDVPVLKVDSERERNQVERLKKFKSARDSSRIDALLDDVRAAARGSANLLYPMKAALKGQATLGEVSDALRDVFGVHRPG